jgi:hypothetical protein
VLEQRLAGRQRIQRDVRQQHEAELDLVVEQRDAARRRHRGVGRGRRDRLREHEHVAATRFLGVSRVVETRGDDHAPLGIDLGLRQRHGRTHARGRRVGSERDRLRGGRRLIRARDHAREIVVVCEQRDARGHAAHRFDHARPAHLAGRREHARDARKRLVLDAPREIARGSDARRDP